MVLYECNAKGNTEQIYERYLNLKGTRCYHPDKFPISWRSCTRIIHAWAVGGEGINIEHYNIESFFKLCKSAIKFKGGTTVSRSCSEFR